MPGRTKPPVLLKPEEANPLRAAGAPRLLCHEEKRHAGRMQCLLQRGD